MSQKKLFSFLPANRLVMLLLMGLAGLLVLLSVILVAGWLFMQTTLQKFNINSLEWTWPQRHAQSLNWQNIEFQYQKRYKVTLQDVKFHFSPKNMNAAPEDNTQNVFPLWLSQSMQRLNISVNKLTITDNRLPNKPALQSPSQALLAIQWYKEIKRQSSQWQAKLKSNWLQALPRSLKIKRWRWQNQCQTSPCHLFGSMQIKRQQTAQAWQLNSHFTLLDSQLDNLTLDNKINIKVPLVNHPNKLSEKHNAQLITVDILSQLKQIASAQASLSTSHKQLENPILSLHSSNQLKTNDILQSQSTLNINFNVLLPSQTDSQQTLVTTTLLKRLTKWKPKHAANLRAFNSALAKATSITAKTHKHAYDASFTWDNQLDLKSFLNHLSQPSQPHAFLNTHLFWQNRIQVDFHRPINVNNLGELSGSFASAFTLNKQKLEHPKLEASVTLNKAQLAHQLSPAKQQAFKQTPLARQNWQAKLTSQWPASLDLNALFSATTKPFNAKQWPLAFSIQTLQTPHDINNPSDNSKQADRVKLNGHASLDVVQPKNAWPKPKAVFLDDVTLEAQHNNWVIDAHHSLKAMQFKSQFKAILTPKKITFMGANTTLKTEHWQANKHTPLHIHLPNAHQLVMTLADKAPSQLLFQAKSLLFTSVLQGAGLQTDVSNLQLSKLKLKAQKQSPFIQTLKANYAVNFAHLQHAQIHPQDWSLEGEINFKTQPKTNTAASKKNGRAIPPLQAQWRGKISNQAGLTLYHNIHATNSQLSADWFLPKVDFMGGNSFQKSFTTWPQNIAFGSGQISANAHTRWPLNTTHWQEWRNLNTWLEKLNGSLRVQLDKLNGIVAETTLNQLSGTLNTSINTGQVNIKSPDLYLQQLNHGAILGPINIDAVFSLPTKNLLQGEWQQGLLTLNRATAEGFNGQIKVTPQSFALNQTFSGTLNWQAIELPALLAQYPTGTLQGTGKISGHTPFTVNLNQPPSFTIDKGQLHALSPGGTLQYQTKSGLSKSHKKMQLVSQLLENFHYELLKSQVSILPNQTLILDLSLHGHNPAVQKGRPIHFNIKLEEDLPALITSMQLSNQVSESIKERIKNRIESEL